MEDLIIFAQIAVSLSVIYVWVFRFHNVIAEFKSFGLSDLLPMAVIPKQPEGWEDERPEIWNVVRVDAGRCCLVRGATELCDHRGCAGNGRPKAGGKCL